MAQTTPRPAASADSERLLDNRYLLRDRIGSGGMSEVYLATDTRLQRPVAIKLLHSALADDPVFVERFRREARTLATLKHPNVVAVYDYGHAEDCEFLVMEYVQGTNLREALRQSGPFSEEEALRLVCEAACGIQAAHDQGIIHRDVKPHNLLLDEHGQLHVTDFGIARSVDQAALTAASSHVLGTAHYISPEQVQGGLADYRSDVYALGIVLYELLTGKPPFDGDTPVAVAVKHVREPIPPLRSRKVKVSRPTEILLARALEKDPRDRFQSAGQLADAAEAARESLSHSLSDADPFPLSEIESTMVLRPLVAVDSTSRLTPVAVDRGPRRETRAETVSRRPALLWAGGALVFALAVLGARQWTPPWSLRASPPPTAVAGVAATAPSKAATPEPARQGATPAAAAATAKPNASAAPGCQFVMGFKQLRDKLPNEVGDCLENERHDASSGNTVQRTSRGVLVWRKSDGQAIFTDGRRTWVDGPGGLREEAPRG